MQVVVRCIIRAMCNTSLITFAVENDLQDKAGRLYVLVHRKSGF